jgi:hypothetical protein
LEILTESGSDIKVRILKTAILNGGFDEKKAVLKPNFQCPVRAVWSMIWPFGRSADPMARLVYISIIRSMSREQQNETDTARISGLGGPSPNG